MDKTEPEPIQAVLIGAGQRGAEAYGPYALAHPDELRFVAVAEPDPVRRERFAAAHAIPIGSRFESWEPLLQGPRRGQAALICTQDRQHTAPTLQALEAGYDVLLEKPMAASPAECRQLVAAAEASGRQLHVAHVLRYTRHFKKMREIVASGILGQIVDVAHRENVSYWHMAHSYVRGNWANRGQSSPMILAKCCHDFDILLWVLGQRCERMSSVGSLRHYRPENAPQGAPQYCLDGCPVAETCPYYAPYIYIDLLPLWRSYAETATGFTRLVARLQARAPGLVRALSRIVPPLREASDYRGWPRSVVAADPTIENLTAALERGPYGRCVYHCDNDVVDHQVVSMQFEGGLSVTLTMHGHSNVEGRTTRIEGSRGALYARFGLGGAWIELREHRSGRRRRYDTSSSAASGHGGGDQGLMAAFVRSLRANPAPGSGETAAQLGLTLAEQALESHLMAFAADQARLEGRTVSRDEWERG